MVGPFVVVLVILGVDSVVLQRLQKAGHCMLTRMLLHWASTAKIHSGASKHSAVDDTVLVREVLVRLSVIVIDDDDTVDDEVEMEAHSPHNLLQYIRANVSVQEIFDRMLHSASSSQLSVVKV